MKKLKDLIYKIKASVYGAFGRVQAVAEPAIDEAIEKIVEAIEEPVSAEPAPEATIEPAEENCVTVKKAPAKKKPGRPKGSQNISKKS